MKKLFMKLCGYVRKLRSSQPTLQPMNVKIPLENVYAFGTMEEETRQMFNEARGEMDYYEWMRYLHNEIQKYEYKGYFNTKEEYLAEVHNQFTYDKNAKNK